MNMRYWKKRKEYRNRPSRKYSKDLYWNPANYKTLAIGIPFIIMLFLPCVAMGEDGILCWITSIVGLCSFVHDNNKLMDRDMRTIQSRNYVDFVYYKRIEGCTENYPCFSQSEYEILCRKYKNTWKNYKVTLFYLM